MSGQLGSSPSRRGRLVSPGVGRCLAVFLALGVFGGVSNSHVARQERGGLSLGSAPIPGEITTLADAQGRAAYPVLIIPDATVSHPCLGTALPLELKEVWASPTALARSDRQVGLTYTSGIWVSFTPKSWYRTSIAAATELPPVSSVFSRDDFPDGLTTDVVRGHTAWIAEAGAGICAAGSESDDAHLEWMENGVVVHLAGPYLAAKLQALAASMIAA